MANKVLAVLVDQHVQPEVTIHAFPDWYAAPVILLTILIGYICYIIFCIASLRVDITYLSVMRW